MEILTQFAATEPAEKQDIFSALGIDWQILVFQIIAFLILVWLLGKYVYPWLMKSVDERQDAIEAGTKAAEQAQAKAEQAEKDVQAMLDQARKEAKEIVVTAKEEATAAIEAADAKAKQRADHIVQDAKEQLDKDVLAARKVLHNETLELVAQATETVVGKTVTAKVDESVIAKAVKEAQ